MPLQQLKTGRAVHINNVPGEADGCPVLCIHGLGSSQNFYGAVIDELRRTRRCVAFDTPGSARSPPPSAAQSVKSISDDVVALMDSLGLQKVILVGHSMGAIIASQTAVDHPTRVEKLILIGPVHPSEKASEVFSQRIRTVRNGRDFISLLILDGMEPLANSIPASATGSRASSLSRAFIRELVLSQDPKGYISLCNVIANASSPEYAKIKCPTLIIAGEEDKSAPLDGCKFIQEGIGNAAKLEVLKGVGHWHCIESPNEVVYAISYFVE